VAGGSLLSPSVVLTTAHNIVSTEASSLTVRAGEWDTGSEREPYPHFDRNVTAITIHENFDISTLMYDIALLKLKMEFLWKPNVGTVCLPGNRENIAFDNCLVTGWGQKIGQQEVNSRILKKIGLSVLESPKCQTLLRRTRVGPYFELDESFICAGGEKDKDACNGDGGSPLVCPFKDTPDRYQLVGLVSWGLDCGASNVPGVYTNVQFLRPWIENHMK
ncbi:hypothetical protein KR222_000487, partial [Zaprionus bogoriensis]